MARNDFEAGATVFPELSPRYRRELVAGGTIRLNRLCDIAADGDIDEAAFNSRRVCGVNNTKQLSAGEPVELSWGPCVVEADAAIDEGQLLKAAPAGRVTPLVDSELAGTALLAATAGGNFGNQPANDGVELISDSASDTQNATVYYTRNGQGDTVFTETKALTGTSQVALTATDVQLVLGVVLSAAAVGTVTVREASANQTITSIAAAGTSAGVVATTSSRAYNQAPVAVAGGASTKQVGLIGTDEDGDTIYDSQALNGTTAVTFNDTFKTVTSVLLGDVASASTVAVSVGAEDDEHLCVGRALEAAAAQGDEILAFIRP